MSTCEDCRKLPAKDRYSVIGVISTMTVELCDVCAEHHGFIERESVDDLLARLGY